MPPDFDSIDKVVADCKSIKDDAQQQADALIMFSCVSRHLSFGMVIKEEIEQVQKIWNAPMAGFLRMENMENLKPVKMNITIMHVVW